MHPYAVVEGARVSRRTRAAVDRLNQEATNAGKPWPETQAGRKARTAKGWTLIFLMTVGIIFGAPLLFAATNDVGMAIIVPVIGVGLINGIWWVFTDETLSGFIASIVFGVASAPVKYVRRAIRKKTVTASGTYSQT